MENTPPEVRTANLIWLVFWVLFIAFILLFGKRWQRIRTFREKMAAKWKPSLVIAASFIISMGLSGRGFLNLHGITLFCQSLIGLTLADSIPDFDSLPVVQVVIQKRDAWRAISLMFLIAVVIVFPALIIGTVGLDIGQQIFGETDFTQQAMETFPENKWITFFLLFGGAGIAEETPFRLVFLSLFWRLTKRRKLSILLSAVVFGGYHLTPLNGMYQIFLQYPISQFLASFLIGLIWGALYTRRGFETAVLGHTLSDWLPFMIFG